MWPLKSSDNRGTTVLYTCILCSELTCSIYGGTQTDDHKQGGDCCRSGDNNETRHREYHKLYLPKVVSAEADVSRCYTQGRLCDRLSSQL